MLDVGAGIGTHSLQLREVADEVVALEPDAELAAILRTRADGIEVVEGDADAVEGPFDAIVCFNVLEHIADDAGTLRRLRELLAPGGALLLLVPAHPALFGTLDRSFGHERRYGKRELGGEARARRASTSRCCRHVNPVGALGWLMQAKIRRREHMSYRGLGLYDRLVPALRALDRVPLPVGLSLWAVAKTTRQRERERQERVEVIELHRQVEGVRGDRPGERGGEPPRERPHARGERVAGGGERPAERARAAAAGGRPRAGTTTKSAVPTRPVSTTSAT